MHGYNGLYHLILVNQMGFMVGWFMGSVYGFWNGNPTKVRLVQKRYWCIPHHHIHVIHGTWVHEPQILCHGNWHFEFGHAEVLSKAVRASEICKAGRCIGLFLQGCIGQGMVMVWSWYVYPRRVERYVHPYIIHTYTHTCVCNNIYFTWKHVASHVNILCTCTSLSIKALGHSFAVCCCVWQGVEWPDCRGDFLHRMTWSRAKSQTPYATDTLFFCSQFVWDVGMGSRTIAKTTISSP